MPVRLSRPARRLAHGLFDLSLRRLLGTITEVKTEERIAALTFDDGPDPEWTPRVLELLAQYEARATFFVLGRSAQQYPDLLARIAGEGHVIGNHSWDHPLFPLISSRERRRQIEACARATAPYGQRLFRPPYGRQDLASRLDTVRLGYTAVTCSVDVGDWWESDAERLAKSLVTQIQPGSVIDLHETLYRARPDLEPVLAYKPFPDRAPMLAALRVCLDELHGQFRFLTLPDLFQRGTPVRHMV